MEDIADLIKLLSLDSPAPVRSAAMEYCLGVTASRTEGLGFFKTNESIVPAIIEVTGDEKYSPIAKDAWLALVNIAAMKDDKLMAKMIEGDVVEKAVAAVMNKDIDYADEVSFLVTSKHSGFYIHGQEESISMLWEEYLCEVYVHQYQCIRDARPLEISVAIVNIH